MARLIYLKNVVTLEFDAEKCSGCGTCLEVCPHAGTGSEQWQDQYSRT